ncbi:MAG: hypothetical protein D6701_00935 [Gemmatimonadetes bacterium]|nr:MAG: hypothetical protein D6701_00935 [Gemmatimonadota bacterium]
MRWSTRWLRAAFAAALLVSIAACFGRGRNVSGVMPAWLRLTRYEFEGDVASGEMIEHVQGAITFLPENWALFERDMKPCGTRPIQFFVIDDVVQIGCGGLFLRLSSTGFGEIIAQARLRTTKMVAREECIRRDVVKGQYVCAETGEVRRPERVFLTGTLDFRRAPSR